MNTKHDKSNKNCPYFQENGPKTVQSKHWAAWRITNERFNARQQLLELELKNRPQIYHSPCHSPCVASPVRKPTREAQGSADQSMKKPILVHLILLNEPLKALMLVASTACWSSWFHLLITRLEKKYLQQSRVHLNLTSFLECPLVPMSIIFV